MLRQSGLQDHVGATPVWVPEPLDSALEASSTTDEPRDREVCVAGRGAPECEAWRAAVQLEERSDQAAKSQQPSWEETAQR